MLFLACTKKQKTCQKRGKLHFNYNTLYITFTQCGLFIKSWWFIWDPSLLLLISVAKSLLSDLVPIIIISDLHKILMQLFQPGFLCDKMTVVLIKLIGSSGCTVCIYKTPRKTFKYEQKSTETPLTEAAENLFSTFPSDSGHTLIAKLHFYGLLVLVGLSTNNSSDTFPLLHTVPEVNGKTPQDLLSFGSASHFAQCSHKPKIVYRLVPTLDSDLPTLNGKGDSNLSSAGKKRQTACNWINESTLANFVYASCWPT